MSIQDQIVAYAQQHGIDPIYALAVASRESSFNPNAHASKTIYGLFQMSGKERERFGVPMTTDVGTQVRGFAGYTSNLKNDMTHRLGREPSPSELYLGHYWGPGRAAMVLSGRWAGLPTGDVFSARELRENPNLKKNADAPVGQVAGSIMNDMDRRYAKYGGQVATGSVSPKETDFTQFGAGDEDPSRFGVPASSNEQPTDSADNPTTDMAMSKQRVADAGYQPEQLIVDPYGGGMAVWPAGPSKPEKTAPDPGVTVDPYGGGIAADPPTKDAPAMPPLAASPLKTPKAPPTDSFTAPPENNPSISRDNDPIGNVIDQMSEKQSSADDDNPLAGLAKSIGGAFSGGSGQKTAAAQPQPQDDPYTDMAMRQLLTPVGGIGMMPGQTGQQNPLLPGSGAAQPPGFNPAMFGSTG